MTATGAAWRGRCAAALAGLVLAACGGGGGGGGGGGDGTAWFDATTYSSDANASLATGQERAAISQHQLALPSGALAYTATVGHLVASDPTSGAPKAAMFYAAYTLNGATAGTRPVTFFFNGGPGSASVWLHLGSFGPRRLATGVPSTTLPRPFALVDNLETMLDVSDLVFVDAVGSGHSQAIAPHNNRSFWGVDADAAVFRDFVRRYVEVNARQASPKWLFGESYGGPRGAVLALLLEQAGVELAGVVLQSPALDYNSNCAVVERTNVSCAGFLPTYAATGAWYQQVQPPPVDDDLFIASARVLADQPYASAVQAWLGSATPPEETLVTQLVANTGIGATTWRTNLNLQPGPVRTGLVSGQLLGRYDSRIAAPPGSTLAQGGDPSNGLIESSFAGAIGPYLASLGYTTPSPYVLFSRAIEVWDFSHDGKALPDTLPDLAAALLLNPALRVLAISGRHDLATPFHQTELDLARLGAVPTLALRDYPGGHMTYLDDASRVRSRADLDTFYRSGP
ncbi:MAG: peptidase S10 [Pseudomonadota bacterium]